MQLLKLNYKNKCDCVIVSLYINRAFMGLSVNISYEYLKYTKMSYSVLSKGLYFTMLLHVSILRRWKLLIIITVKCECRTSFIINIDLLKHELWQAIRSIYFGKLYSPASTSFCT